MAEQEYRPIAHDHDEFLARAMKRKGFAAAYEHNSEGYELVRELLAARAKAGLTQEQVAECMGTTKSAISRLEAVGKHSPSMRTLGKYARAVGCDIQIRLVPRLSTAERPASRQSRMEPKQRGRGV